MVDNRGFLVTRSFTVGVPMMHRTGEFLCHLYIRSYYVSRTDNCQQKNKHDKPSVLSAGLYDFHEDTENRLFVLNMPLGKKQASMILIMPYHLEPLERLEKLLTRKQVDTWLSKMENKAVAISLPKISLEVSHNLQVSGGKERIKS